MGLPRSIIWGNTIGKWVISAQNDIPGIVSAEWKRYPLERLNSVPCHLLEIPTTPPDVHPALVSPLVRILLAPMHRAAATFKTIIIEITHGTNFDLVNMLHAKNTYLIMKDLNTSIDELETKWTIHLVKYDILTSRVTPSSNGRLSYRLWSFGIFGESQWYYTTNSIGRQILINTQFGFKLQVKAKPAFHSLYDWCYETM
jgi:hypothetical protein